jgi:phenylacetic acid degradation operon negative regulatory protein
VIASTLLGTHPPRLSSRLLVRSGELFGIAEGTTRTAISRMVAAGELEADGTGYRLAGSLLDRQVRQDASRRAVIRRWDRRWEMDVVVGERRSAGRRSELRDAMRALKLAELREGVWLRPANLDADRAPPARAVVDEQCEHFVSTPAVEPASLAAELWDLDGWSKEAAELTRSLDRHLPGLERGETSALRDGFVLSAAVLRHFVADPLLPGEILPPRWPGDALRRRYEVYDAAFKAVWRDWFQAQRNPPPQN